MARVATARRGSTVARATARTSERPSRRPAAVLPGGALAGPETCLQQLQVAQNLQLVHVYSLRHGQAGPTGTRAVPVHECAGAGATQQPARRPAPAPHNGRRTRSDERPSSVSGAASRPPQRLLLLQRSSRDAGLLALTAPTTQPPSKERRTHVSIKCLARHTQPFPSGCAAAASAQAAPRPAPCRHSPQPRVVTSAPIRRSSSGPHRSRSRRSSLRPHSSASVRL